MTMKVLQIVGDSRYGGATYLILEWSRFLLQRGCQVDVLTTDSATIEALSKVPGVHVIGYISIPRDISLTQDALAFSQLFSLLSREKYDVVHTYTATPSFLGRIAARLTGISAILHHQAGWAVNEFSSLLQRLVYTPLEYLMAMASTRCICVSKAITQQAIHFHLAPQRKLVTICNGINPQPFIEVLPRDARCVLQQELGITSNHLLLGNTGRLAPQKDNETLLRAMVSLKTILDAPFTLLLAGDGPERRNLENLAVSLCIQDKVRFLGFRHDIPHLLAALDIFINPSLWEGLSISLLEAMAAAKPIITTSILPNAELIEHEVTGLLVPPRSPEQVAQAIARFVQEPDLARQCALAAREGVLEHYTIERMFRETWDLYVSLLQKKTKRGSKDGIP